MRRLPLLLGFAVAFSLGSVLADRVSDPAVAEGATAGVNADRVDGVHAVRYTTSRGRRAGKLVATNSSGYLPDNIVRPRVPTIETTDRGNTASNQLFGTGTHTLSVSCPSGWERTGGGFGFDGGGGDTDEYAVLSSGPTGSNSWSATFRVSQTTTLRVVVSCMRLVA